MDSNLIGLEIGQDQECEDLLIGQPIDRHEHFYYADQLYAERSNVAALELMDDLNLDVLPLVDRELRIVDVLRRA